MKGSLDIRRMQEAATAFVGSHDFRNFCKMDVTKVTHFTRVIHSIAIVPLPFSAVGLQETLPNVGTDVNPCGPMHPFAIVITGTVSVFAESDTWS